MIMKAAVLLIPLVMLPPGLTSAADAVSVNTLAETVGNGGITVHPGGDLYIGDFGNVGLANGDQVTRVNPDGETDTFISGIGSANSGNDFDANGNLIQAAWGSNRIRLIAPTANRRTLANISGPVGVVAAPDGDIFVASCPTTAVAGAGGIIRLRGNAAPEQFAAHPEFFCPNGLTQDELGVLYTVNWVDGKVFAIEPSGDTRLIGDIPGGGGHLVYGNGELYVAGRTTNRIYRISLDGNVAILAGTGSDGNRDGAPMEATFSRPNGIAISNDGSWLYTNGNSESTQAGGTGFNAIRAIELDVAADTTFEINYGLGGAWFNPDTDGQGLYLEFIPSRQEMIAGWFTYDPRSDSTGRSKLPGENHRWLTLQGSYSEYRVQADVIRSSGGVFDDPTPVASAVTGSVEMEFTSCAEGMVSYDLPEIDRQGSFRIVRLAPDVICQTLSEN